MSYALVPSPDGDQASKSQFDLQRPEQRRRQTAAIHISPSRTTDLWTYARQVQRAARCGGMKRSRVLNRSMTETAAAFNHMLIRAGIREKKSSQSVSRGERRTA
jgi:hypothetical protein